MSEGTSTKVAAANDTMQVDQDATGVEIEEETLLPPAQKRAVDEAFEDLFGYKWGTCFQLPYHDDGDGGGGGGEGTKAGKTNSKQRKKKNPDNDDDPLPRCTLQQQRLLVQIFGVSRASRIIQAGKGIVIPYMNRRRRVPSYQSSASGKSPSNPQQTKIQSAASTSQSQQSQQQYETKMFAGKPIQVAARSTFPSGGKNATAKPAAGGLDQALQQLAGPSKISTVAKTSADWDQFKTDTGLEAELEKKAQGKDAYLVKQDFLTRVDARKFDLEKQERDKERAKRGK